MVNTPDRWQTFDLVEAFQLAQAVAALHDLGVLAMLEKPATADDVAAKRRLNPDLLRGTLEFVAARTNLLRKSAADRFVATRNYAAESQFLLDLYVGAYGGNANDLKKLLRNPSSAPAMVDRAHYAHAFAAVDGRTLGILPELIRQLGFERMLDIGCGNGDLLITLARKDSNFIGWGIDSNRAMLDVAQSRIRRSRLEKRLALFEGDCRNLKAALPARVRAGIRSLTACNVANEMFHDGQRQCIKWLQQLRKLFPERPLLILDYYSQLGKKSRQGPMERKTLLHDFAQLISGQGIPPANAREWRALYSEAGCRLIHIIEDNVTTRFIHLLRL
jgi:SAM-dependent methyltransferase